MLSRLQRNSLGSGRFAVRRTLPHRAHTCDGHPWPSRPVRCIV